MVFAREVDGQTLTFGVSGSLLMNALVMYDHETDSLWSQVLGRAVEGPLAGKELRRLPALQTEWGAWRELHPDTLVLDTAAWEVADPYEAYYASGAAGVLGEARRDERLPRKALVVGVLADGAARAYPLEALRAHPVVNDAVGGQPVVVALDPATDTVVVFSRRVGERALTFAAGRERLGLRDRETGSTWHVLTGQALSGPLEGRRLGRLPAHTAFWFAWKDFYPHTEVWAPEDG